MKEVEENYKNKKMKGIEKSEAQNVDKKDENEYKAKTRKIGRGECKKGRRSTE